MEQMRVASLFLINVQMESDEGVMFRAAVLLPS
jgi:hypothetical protein